jgi:hypothetical protein
MASDLPIRDKAGLHATGISLDLQSTAFPS